MSKSASSFLVTLLALILVSPVVGMSNNIIEQNSQLLQTSNQDYSRGDYEVSLEFAEGNTGFEEVTRNQALTAEFTVSNTGTFDDTYNLSVSWDDEYNVGWDAQADQASVSVASGTQESITFTFQAPVQGVYDGDSMDFTVKATSQNSTSISDQRQFSLDIDMIYAVDIYLRESPNKGGNRGEVLYYSIEVKNVGETSEEFTLEVGNLPWDWQAETNLDSVQLDPDDFETITLEVTIPMTSAEDEYAVIQTFARVQTQSYDYIYGFCETNTSVNDGLVYAVDIIPDAIEKQVIPGGQVLYSLYVTNEGDSSDSYTLEIGDVMKEGWGSNLSQFVIEDLGPGEQTAIVMNVTSPEGSQENDWSTSFISVTSISRNQFGDFTETNTSVRIPVIGLSLSVDTENKNGDPGTTVIYTVSLENTGSDPDDFQFEALRLCDDCSAWGVDLSSYDVTDLEDGDVFEFELHVEIPNSARFADSAEFGVSAASQSDTTVTGQISTVTSVDKVLNRQVSWECCFVMNPGNSGESQVMIENLGNSIQSYTFESDEIPNGWTFDNLPYQTGDLEGYGGTEDFVLTFTVAENENPGFFNFTIDVILNSDNFKVAEITMSIKIEYYAEFTIDVLDIDSYAGPGEMHHVTISIQNNANFEDDINLEITGLPEGWDACILVNNVCSSKVSVEKGGLEHFQLHITTNQDEPANTVNGVLLRVEAVSGLNSKVTGFDTFIVYTNPVYELLVEVPTDRKEAESGDTIPFQITVTNKGNAIDYVNLPSPTAPAGWTASFSESSFTLAAQQSKTIYLNINVPDNTFGGDNEIITKVSSDQSGQTIDLSFAVYIDEKAAIDVELKTVAGDIMAGTTGKFTVRITNNGNTIEKCAITIEGKRASWFTAPSETDELLPGGWQEITIEVSPPVMQAATEASGTLNVTLSSDSSISVKKSLGFTVLKSDLVIDEPDEETENSLLPGPGLFSVILLISLISRITRRR